MRSIFIAIKEMEDYLNPTFPSDEIFMSHLRRVRQDAKFTAPEAMDMRWGLLTFYVQQYAFSPLSDQKHLRIWAALLGVTLTEARERLHSQRLVNTDADIEI